VRVSHFRLGVLAVRHHADVPTRDVGGVDRRSEVGAFAQAGVLIIARAKEAMQTSALRVHMADLTVRVHAQGGDRVEVLVWQGSDRWHLL